MTSQRRRFGGFCGQLAVLVLLGLALRLGWVSRQSTDAADIGKALPDQREYLEAGRSLLAGRGLGFFDARFDQTVYAYRTPGYPAVIALCGGSITLTRVAQAILDASTILAVALLALNLGLSRGTALIAGLFVALDPFLIYFSALLLSETLYVAMLIWAMALLTIGNQRENRWMPVAADVLLGLSLLVRPSALLLPIFLRVAAAFVARQSPRQLIIGLSSTFCCCGIVLCSWGYRNHCVLGNWIFTSTNSGITMYDGFNPAATGASDQRFIQPLLPALRQMNEVQRSRYFNLRAWQFIRSHPWRCVTLTIRKIARTWSPLPLSETFQTRAYTLAGLFFSLPLDVLVIVGLFAKHKSRGSSPIGASSSLVASKPLPARGLSPASTSPPAGASRPESASRTDKLSAPAKLFLLAPAAYFTVVHGLSVGSLRYRLPAEPSMAVIAAFALCPVLCNLYVAWMGRPSDNCCAQPTAES